MSVAVSMPAVAMPNDNIEDYTADGVIIANGPYTVDAPVCRYAGPEYFGFTNKTINTDVNKQIPQIRDVAQYTQINSAQINENTTIKDINNVTNINNQIPSDNFVNSQYGSVKVVEPSAHYIFK